MRLLSENFECRWIRSDGRDDDDGEEGRKNVIAFVWLYGSFCVLYSFFI